MVGRQIAHYQIKALLGRGRVGNVYQAIDLEDFSLVAVKIIDIHLTQEKGMRRQFLQEVNTIPRLDHPSIVKVHEAGIDTEENILYMTMDYLTGRSLNSYLRQLNYNETQLALGDALIIVAQIAEALDYAHQKNLLHRDIRPSVILFRTDDTPEESKNLPGRAVISDFALKSILAVEKEPFAPALPYLPPEAFLDRPLDNRSDIYSLGILLYQLTTGRLPFSPTSYGEAARQHPYQEPPSPRDSRPEMPQAIENAILKAMAKAPEGRYQSGAEMASALRLIVETLPERMEDGADIQMDMHDVETTIVPPYITVSGQWSEEDDHIMVTRDVPRSLNRQIVTIGRSENNDIVLSDTAVTRQHAQLERIENGWQVRDLGSSNGTFIDEKPLLPDIPEEWEPHQTLRVGPFFMHLQPGKGHNYQARPFQAILTPTEVSVQPGERAEVAVTIRNKGTAVDSFNLKIERIAAEWVSLPADPIRLRPDEQTTIIVRLHPPLSKDVLLGMNRFLVVVESQSNPDDFVSIPGELQVLKPKNAFIADLDPVFIARAGQSFLTLQNRSLDEQEFNISGQNLEGEIRFSVWRQKETPPVKKTTPSANGQSAATQTGSSQSSTSEKLGPLNKLSFVRRMASAPTRFLRNVESGPRQALNKIMPGLGSMVPRLNLNQKAGDAFQGTKTQKEAQEKPTPKIDPNIYEEVIFPGSLHTQVTVPAGGKEIVQLGFKPHKRPLFGRNQLLLPYSMRVSTIGSEPQTIEGQVEVKPRIRINPKIFVVLFFLLFLCLGSYLIYSLYENSTLVAMLNTPIDIDEDGLSNLAEVYVYDTDPNLADTDGDMIHDGAEIMQGTDPRRTDTDEDGLTDGEERELNTNPRYSDTDGDNLSDGLEARRLSTNPLLSDTLTITISSLSTPTITPIPTPTPTATPMPTVSPSSFSQPFRSIGSEDGYIMDDPTLGRAPVTDDSTLQIGEGDRNNRQIKGFLSFDTSDLPEDAIIISARLMLHRNNIIGQPEKLGQIHIDIAPQNGFNNNWELEGEDFSDFANDTNVATIRNLLSGEWLEVGLSESGIQALNLNGRTQFRLYFTLPNDNDGEEDRISFHSGDTEDSSVHPQLIIDYELPQ